MKNSFENRNPAEEGIMAARQDYYRLKKSKKRKHKTKSVKKQLIPNNYKGKTPAEVWNGWSKKQKSLFLNDHKHLFSFKPSKSYISEDIANLDYADLKYYYDIKDVLNDHVKGGQYEDGGKAKGKATKTKKTNSTEINLDYESKILPAIKDQIVDAWDNISVANELDNKDGQEVESKSRDGFIPFTDGGWKMTGFQTLQYFEGTGKRVGGTNKAKKLLENHIDQGYQYAKDWFNGEYPDIVKKLGENKINYHDLMEAGYTNEAERLSEAEMDNLSDDNSTIMFELGAYYYTPENSHNEFKGHSVTVFGTINFEAPYHRHYDKLEDYVEYSFEFKNIEELNKKLRKEIEKVLTWFAVNKKYENGGFTAGAKNLWNKSKKAASAAYEKAKPAAKSAYEKGKKATKEAYDKTKIAVKKKIHDEKKKVAIEVISEMEDKSANPKEKETLEESMNIVWDKYEAGGKTPEFINGNLQKDFKSLHGKKLKIKTGAWSLAGPKSYWIEINGKTYNYGLSSHLKHDLGLLQEQDVKKKGNLISSLKKSSSVKSKLADGGDKYTNGAKISGLKAVEVAEELSPLQFEGYDALKLQAFPTDNMDKQRDLYQYILKKLNSKFKKYKGKLTKDVYDELENENYHVLNSILAYNGWFDESLPAAKKKSTGYFDEEAVKMENGGQSFADDELLKMLIKHSPQNEKLWRDHSNKDNIKALIGNYEKSLQLHNLNPELVKYIRDNHMDVVNEYISELRDRGNIGDYKKAADDIEELFETKMENGGISRKKARMILHEGKAHGRNITDKQRRFFGARASGYPVKRNEDGGAYEHGGKTDNLEDIAQEIYLKFLDRCKEYFENDPLIESINKEYELVSTNDPDGIKHAMKYYQDKTSHKADIFKNAGADELSKAFIKASRNAEDINFPLK